MSEGAFCRNRSGYLFSVCCRNAICEYRGMPIRRCAASIGPKTCSHDGLDRHQMRSRLARQTSALRDVRRTLLGLRCWRRSRRWRCRWTGRRCRNTRRRGRRRRNVGRWRWRSGVHLRRRWRRRGRSCHLRMRRRRRSCWRGRLHRADRGPRSCWRRRRRRSRPLLLQRCARRRRRWSGPRRRR